jgi:hypothetical protein
MRRSKAFTIINRELYKHSTTGVLQWCIAQEDGIALLREIHEGTCGHHASSRDKDHASDPTSFVPIFHSESTRINNLPITR